MVSLASGMLCIGICHQMEIPNQKWYGIFIFSSTFFTYNLQRYLKAFQLISHPTNLILWVISHKRLILLFLLSSSVIGFYSFLKLYNWGIGAFAALFFSASISLLYVLRFNNRSLRDIPLLKIHLIALIWIIACGVFQLINEENYIIKNWCFVGIHYFYIISVTIPFDIRDVKYDHPNQRTIPQVIGIHKSKILSIFLLVLYLGLIILIKHQMFYNLLFLLAFTSTIFLIIGIHEKRSEFYYSGLIEGSIFVLGLSYME